MTAHRKAATTLVLRLSLLSWIQMQLVNPQAGEIDLWIEVLGNIVHSLNHAKCDQVTYGAWRTSLISCLIALSSPPG